MTEIFDGLAEIGFPMWLFWGSIIIGVISLVMMVAALIAVLVKKVPGGDKIFWVLVIILSSPIGPILYFIMGAKRLKAMADAGFKEGL